MIRICLHGPESTGKTSLGLALSEHLAAPFVPEYGRAYCAEHGNDISMAELVHIATEQQHRNAAAAGMAAPWAIFDTDALVTAIWADVMFGRRDPWFATNIVPADLYLLTDIDLPFVEDGQRIYGATDARSDFLRRCREELIHAGVNWRRVSGTGERRFENALNAIREATGMTL